MNNERYNQIIDDAYKNYLKHYDNLDPMELLASGSIMIGASKPFIPFTLEEFINKCKTDQEFSERWGLKIEERGLSLEESAKWLQDVKGYDLLDGNLEHDYIREVVEEEGPTKLITLLYNNEIIEVYE
jgi:hypothetical protein